jgi:tetratricopeptide (TPR) repeat protein
MADQRERQVDQFIEGSLTPVQARELAQAALESPELFEELTYQAVANAGLPEYAAREKLSSLPQGGADPMESYVSGKLSRAAERQLAQAALDDEDLFDALVTHGAVERSLRDPAFRKALSTPLETRAKVLGFPHKTRAIAIGSIAAALTLVGIYSWKSLSSGRNQPSQANVGTATRVPAPSPSLDFAAGRPILLAADLRPDSVKTEAIKNGATPVFRGADTESRPPQPNGTVLSIDDRQATISLGSLDGLTKGTEIQIFRGANSKQPIARILVTTVFRDSARGLITGGQSIRENDRVSAQPAVYLAAVLEETNRLADSGESEKGRSMARSALTWADSAAVSPGAAERKIFERLGALDFQAGDAVAAEKDYRSAAASFDTPPSESAAEQAATLNSLGVLYLLRSDYAQAEAQLNQARATVTDGKVYARTLNNLAVLAELRGDAPKAAALYRDALRALGHAAQRSSRDDTSEDRKAVDANLARLGSVADGKR